MTIERTIIIVFDSLGVGELPDARDFGDAGSNTLANTAKAVGGLDLPNLADLGLGNIIEVEGVGPVPAPAACFGKLLEQSIGKDTTVGHWELMGICSSNPFPTYPDGFPPALLAEFKKMTGLDVLGNRAASGTKIIEELGEEHQKSGKPIVYTSADSVWQIAAHQDTIPLERLYELSEAARKMLVGAHSVARVIARPFIGAPGSFTRTHWRKDFSIEPPGPTLLDFAHNQGVKVLAAGKISEIFAGRGIDRSAHTSGNQETIDLMLEYMDLSQRSIIFANLVDFDMLWGHRNDPSGYAGGLEAADQRIPEIIAHMKDSDLLILTADHGCDPTTASTDHSREYVPALMYGRQCRSGVDLGVRQTFSDIAQTIAEGMGISVDLDGESFWKFVARTLG